MMTESTATVTMKASRTRRDTVTGSSEVSVGTDNPFGQSPRAAFITVASYEVPGAFRVRSFAPLYGAGPETRVATCAISQELPVIVIRRVPELRTSNRNARACDFITRLM